MNVARKPPFLEELERRVLVCDGAMGTMLYARGSVPEPLVRRAEPDPARAGRRRAPCLRPGRRRRHRDEHFRRQPGQARRPSAWPTRTRRDQRPRGATRAPRGAGRLRRRIDRPARRPHRALGQDRRGRGAGPLRGAGRGAARGGRRPLRARDVPRSQRDRRGDPRGAQRVRACRSSRRSRRKTTATRSTARRRTCSCRSSNAKARTSSA